MAEPVTVSSRAGVIELRNRRWLLRVGIDGWLDPGFLLDL